MQIISIILSGGKGARLWPLSRSLYPKQFLPLVSDKTLFQETLERLQILGLQNPIVVCNNDHRFIVAENLQELDIKAQSILLEPLGRNTAPAIAAAAMVAMKNNDDPVLMVMPADHIIEDMQAYKTAIKSAFEYAQKGHMVTFGIKPTHAHSGYGYIETGSLVDKNVHQIASFKEKPNAKTAETFVKSGKHLWNSGMFCFKASAYLEELRLYQPELLKFVQQSVENAASDLDFDRLDKDAFEKCPDVSIDYAVMEHTQKGVVVGLDAHWSDVGSWDLVWEISKKDKDGNVCKGDIFTKDSRQNYIYSDEKLVCVLGANNLVVIDTKDALLVADKDSVENIKELVGKLKKENRKEVLNHKTVYRPWGHYTCISEGQRYQAKRISVKAGAKLSLQKHYHRSEHWIVVKGTAKVTKGEETFMLAENESVYLPSGIIHALENTGKSSLEIIEVQTGDRLDEDDIVRLEDLYGRVYNEASA